MTVIEAFNQWFHTLASADQYTLLRYLSHNIQQAGQSAPQSASARSAQSMLSPRFGGRNLGSATTSKTCPHCGKPI
jgi:hypothetical protein